MAQLEVFGDESRHSKQTPLSAAHRLPSEILTHIWSFCDLEERILEVVMYWSSSRPQVVTSHLSGHHRVSLEEPQKHLSRPKLRIRIHGIRVPILLRVDQQTRKIAKRRFRRFTLKLMEGRLYWIDPERDIFAIMDHGSSLYGRPDDEIMRRIKRFAYTAHHDGNKEWTDLNSFSTKDSRQLAFGMRNTLQLRPGPREYIILFECEEISKAAREKILRRIFAAVRDPRDGLAERRYGVERIYDARHGPTEGEHSIVLRIDTITNFLKRSRVVDHTTQVQGL